VQKIKTRRGKIHKEAMGAWQVLGLMVGVWWLGLQLCML